MATPEETPIESVPREVDVASVVEQIAESNDSSPQQDEEPPMNGYEGESHADHNTVASEPEYVNVTIRDNLETPNDEDQSAEVEGNSQSSRSVQRSFAELVKGWGDDRPVETTSTQPTKSKVPKNSSPDPITPSSVTDKGPTIHLAESGPPSALYLNQLPEDVTSPDQLFPLFAPYGPIRKIDVHPKGYAFVNYTEGPSVAKVLELAATTPEVFSVNGHVIQVREKINKPKAAGTKDKKAVDKFKKEGWKSRPQGEKMTGEKKQMNRTKTDKLQGAQGAKAAKK